MPSIAHQNFTLVFSFILLLTPPKWTSNCRIGDLAAIADFNDMSGSEVLLFCSTKPLQTYVALHVKNVLVVPFFDQLPLPRVSKDIMYLLAYRVASISIPDSA